MLVFAYRQFVSVRAANEERRGIKQAVILMTLIHRETHVPIFGDNDDATGHRALLSEAATVTWLLRHNLAHQLAHTSPALSGESICNAR